MGRQLPPERIGLVRSADGGAGRFRCDRDLLLHARAPGPDAASHQRAARTGIVRAVLRADGGTLRAGPRRRCHAPGNGVRRMSRAFILVLDSLGVGGAPDAASFGDEGSDTLGHIADACAAGDADKSGHRSGILSMPNLTSLGLGECSRSATGREPPGLETATWAKGRAGAAAEVSTGKDSQSGHWEIAGSPVHFEWGYFPRTQPCFPERLVEALCERGRLPGILGNKHASGTE